MINPADLRHYIIRPTLESLSSVIPYSLVAENLVMGTCAVESDMGFSLAQRSGPAIGIFQMEPKTHRDIYDNYLAYKGDLVKIVRSYRGCAEDVFKMYGDLKYAAMMARVHYYRVKEALPSDPNDIEALGRYWKKYYNTREGSGTVDKFVTKYHDYIL